VKKRTPAWKTEEAATDFWVDSINALAQAIAAARAHFSHTLVGSLKKLTTAIAHGFASTSPFRRAANAQGVDRASTLAAITVAAATTSVT
jgi:hypothetical protein